MSYLIEMIPFYDYFGPVYMFHFHSNIKQFPTFNVFYINITSERKISVVKSYLGKYTLFPSQ